MKGGRNIPHLWYEQLKNDGPGGMVWSQSMIDRNDGPGGMVWSQSMIDRNDGPGGMGLFCSLGAPFCTVPSL